MDLNEQRVLESLTQLFLQERVLFWCDPDAQFSALVDHLLLSGVELIHLDRTPALAVKLRLQRDPSTRFLLYSVAPEPEREKDWLLDVRCRSKTFCADLASILIEDLGLTALSLAPYIRTRSKFLSADARRNKLKRLVEPGDDEAALDRKMLAVLLRSEEADGLSIGLRLLHSLWIAGRPGIASDSKTWIEICSYGLDQAFWDLMQQSFGYANESASLDDLLLRILVTDFVRTIRLAAPEALRHLRIEHRVLAGNASILATRWRSDVNYRESYAELSANVGNALKLEELITKCSAEDLLECMTFARVEHRIIQDLRDRVLAQGAAALADVTAVASRRRDGHWSNVRVSHASEEARAMAACYDALQAASEYLALKERHAAGLSFPDAASAAAAYRSELYRFDQLYRGFWHAAITVEPSGWTVLHELRTLIESAYSGWFIPELSSAWNDVLEGPSGLLKQWQLPGMESQHRFFDRHVASLLSYGAKRVYVIISDAFRYEAAEELVREINSRNRLTAKLDALLGVLPSYTALGMASLLPHQTLAYKEGANLDVLVDERSAASMDARNAQLGRFDGIAVRAPDLLALGKHKGRELVANRRVVYVYHDLIDMIGDKRGSEDKTFQAVADTLVELNQLVAFIVNNLNASVVLVTADHGFMYQESALDQASKSALPEKPPSTLRAKKRFLLGKNLPANDKVWQGNTAISSGTTSAGSLDYWLPKGAIRFHFAGGARFVHGSAMPQEVIVPLITVRVSESDKARTRPVDISLMGVSNKVVTNTQRFELIQTEPVSNRVLPRSVRISIRDGETLLSDEPIVTFDSPSTVMSERVKSVIMTLRSGSYERQKDYHFVVRDAQSQVEVLRVPLRIDLAFTNDF